jgi:hypothetical protein
MGISLLVITNGRYSELCQTIESVENNIDYPFDHKIIINDSQDSEFTDLIHNKFIGFEVLDNRPKGGLSGSINHGWDVLKDKTDYIFHLEDDFLFNQKMDIPALCQLLEKSGAEQMLLKRDAVMANPIEAAAGGYIESCPDEYAQHEGYMTHRKLFSLNPGIYSTELCKLGWPQGGGESEFTDIILSDPNKFLAICGAKFDAPLVTHIGHFRNPDWKL